MHKHLGIKSGAGILAGATAVTTALLAPAMVGAAEEESALSLEEVVVTATRSGETRLHETPIAVTVVSQDYLDDMVASDIRDLRMITPGLTISSNANLAQISIRGIGSANVFAGADPSSTIHQDGVYIARPQAGFANFLDVERVEVLRGPQGTLYGRNSVGGTINVISKRPSLDEVSGRLQGTWGNSNFQRYDGYFTSPIARDKLAVSLAGQYSSKDPMRENVAPGGEDVDDEDVRSIRGQVLWQASDAVEFVLRSDYYRDESNMFAGNTLILPPDNGASIAESIVGDYDKVALNAPSTSDRERYGLSLEANIDLGDMWSLKYLTAYRDNSIAVAADPDATEIDVVRTLLWEDQDQFSSELNLIGNYENLDLFFGLFYFEEDIDSKIEVQVRGAGISSIFAPIVQADSWAAFGQGQYSLTDKFSVTLGGRYTEETKDWDKLSGIFLTGTDTQLVDTSPQSESAKYTNFTPKFGLEYKPNDNTMVYGTVSKGFKSGGFNMVGGTPGGYDPEIMWAYEVGLKNRFAAGRISTSLSAFYYDYSDLQVLSFITPGVTDITNAASAEVTGAELEASGQLTEGLLVRATLAYLDAEYKNYGGAPVSGGAGGTFDASGNKLGNAPEWSGSLLVEYSNVFEWGTVRVTGEYAYQSEVFFSNTNSDFLSQSGYGVANANIGYTTPNEKIDIILWTRNLTEQDYLLSASTIVNTTGTAGPQRSYGLRFNYNF